MQHWLSTLLCLLPGLAADDWTVLEPSRAAEARKMLYTHLQGQAARYFDARRAAVAALQSPDDLRRRQQTLRDEFIRALGGFPEKTPLAPHVTGQFTRGGYRIEKVIFESRPNHHVTAVVYLPDGADANHRVPGVLVPCGHSANGKAAEAYQRACILMARNGLAVLCYDPIGQGERSQLLDAAGKPAVPGSTTEHSLVGVGALLVGRGAASYRIWDGIRALDYLASRREIDAARLGCTGNSGGGTLTAYLMALDDRILAAAPSCYVTTLERLFATIGPQDAEQNITGQVAFGMEHTDYVTMRAPRPTLICVGTQDYFDIDGAWTTFREAKWLYGMLGHGERVDLFEYNDKHGFSQPRREAAMRWMRRWLLQKDDAPTETEFPICKDEELQCTTSGQVLKDTAGKSAFDLNIEAAESLAAVRSQTRGRLDLGQVRRLLALPAEILPAKRTDRGAVERPDYSIQKLLFETEPGIQVPALLFVPRGKSDAATPTVLYLHGDGKAADAGPDGPIAQRVRAGQRVLAIDLRGTGETAPAATPPRTPGYFGTDSKETFLALHLNRPLLGQRVYDVLSVAAALAGEHEMGLHIVGVGAAGPVALHAAAFAPRTRQLTIERSIRSWTDVVRTPLASNQLCNVVPGALAVYDLPELAARLDGIQVTIRQPVAPTGKDIISR